MRTLLMVMLLVGALCGGFVRSNRISLNRGRRNSLNFACGAVDRNGRPGFYKERYSYTFSGIPSWATVSGSNLDCNVPSYWWGEVPVTINYRSSTGRNWGSQTYVLVPSGYSSTGSLISDGINLGLQNLGYYIAGIIQDYTNAVIQQVNQAVSDSYVVFCPIIQNPSSQLYVTPTIETVDSYDSVSDGNIWGTGGNTIATSGSGLAAIAGDNTVITDSSSGNVIVSTPSGTIISTGDGGSIVSSSSGTIVSGGSGIRSGCSGYPSGVIFTPGSGIVTAIGSDYITVDGRFNLGLNGCTRRTYGAGRRNFNLYDRINYEYYPNGGTYWAKTVTCNCN